MKKESIDIVAKHIKKYHLRFGDLTRNSTDARKLLTSATATIPTKKDRKELEEILLSGPNNPILQKYTREERRELITLIASKVHDDKTCKHCGCSLGPKAKSFYPSEFTVTYCSTKCLANDPDIIERKDRTKVARYGEDYKKVIAERSRATIKKHYGVTNISKLESIKIKKAETMLLNYGEDNPSKVKSIQQKKIETSLARYGTEHPNQSVEIREKIESACLKKYGLTSTGGDPGRIKKMRHTLSKRSLLDIHISNGLREKTNKKKYGVKSVMHDPGVRHRNMVSRMDYDTLTIKNVQFTHLQGYEKAALEFLASRGFNPKRLRAGRGEVDAFWYKKDGKDKRYYPDFRYEDRFYEIKSTWTSGIDNVNPDWFSTLRLKMRGVESSGFSIWSMIGVRAGPNLRWVVLRSSKFRKTEVLKAVKRLKITDKQFLLL